jgi:CheY-like chemotaxis protein
MDDAPVLIVDDDRDVRESLRDLLADEGYATVEASNGAEALEYLRTHACPLVLLDWNMPIMDAPMLTVALAAEGLAPPIILLTADTRMLESAKLGPYLASMKKPVNVTALFEVIRTRTTPAR